MNKKCTQTILPDAAMKGIKRALSSTLCIRDGLFVNCFDPWKEKVALNLF